MATRTPSANPPWMEKPNPVARVGKIALLTVLAILMLFPFVYVIAVSFSSYKDMVGGGLILLPAHPTTEAYRAIFRGGIVTHALWVSTVLTLIGTAINMLMTVTMAYGLSRPGVPGSRLILALVLLTLLFSAGLIPNYLLVKQLGLINSYGSLVLPGVISAFNLVILRQFFMSLPAELIESARLDGASDLWVLFRIILPLSKPVLAVVALFYGVVHWNDFFAATLYLNDAHKWPIQLVLRQYVLQGSTLANAVTIDPNQPPPPTQTIQMAVVVIATVPILIVYPLLQRYFTRGVLTGAIKG
ncbi:MAG: carbohydrate ABC transporter permease [Thermomicrobia bacterium]|nr:carbohydrate ABC transporter permease [Thermomicrobia bacterium]